LSNSNYLNTEHNSILTNTLLSQINHSLLAFLLATLLARLAYFSILGSFLTALLLFLKNLALTFLIINIFELGNDKLNPSKLLNSCNFQAFDCHVNSIMDLLKIYNIYLKMDQRSHYSNNLNILLHP